MPRLAAQPSAWPLRLPAVGFSCPLTAIMARLATRILRGIPPASLPAAALRRVGRHGRCAREALAVPLAMRAMSSARLGRYACAAGPCRRPQAAVLCPLRRLRSPNRQRARWPRPRGRPGHRLAARPPPAAWPWPLRLPGHTARHACLPASALAARAWPAGFVGRTNRRKSGTYSLGGMGLIPDRRKPGGHDKPPHGQFFRDNHHLTIEILATIIRWSVPGWMASANSSGNYDTGSLLKACGKT